MYCLDKSVFRQYVGLLRLILCQYLHLLHAWPARISCEFVSERVAHRRICFIFVKVDISPTHTCGLPTSIVVSPCTVDLDGVVVVAFVVSVGIVSFCQLSSVYIRVQFHRFPSSPIYNVLVGIPCESGLAVFTC